MAAIGAIISAIGAIINVIGIVHHNLYDIDNKNWKYFFFPLPDDLNDKCLRQIIIVSEIIANFAAIRPLII